MQLQITSFCVLTVPTIITAFGCGNFVNNIAFLFRHIKGFWRFLNNFAFLFGYIRGFCHFLLIFLSFLVSECDKLLWNSWKFILASADDADDDRTEINPAKRAKTNKKK
jgi:hypothetical protein